MTIHFPVLLRSKKKTVQPRYNVKLHQVPSVRPTKRPPLAKPILRITSYFRSCKITPTPLPPIAPIRLPPPAQHAPPRPPPEPDP
jgi:hypothetical protein